MSEVNQLRRISIGACMAEEQKGTEGSEYECIVHSVCGECEWCVDGKKTVCGANDDMRTEIQGGPRIRKATII